MRIVVIWEELSYERTLHCIVSGFKNEKEAEKFADNWVKHYPNFSTLITTLIDHNYLREVRKNMHKCNDMPCADCDW